jgi:hypothetical protein
MATSVVDAIASNVRVYNVIQIGLEKIISISVFGQRINLREGSQFPFSFATEDGWPVDVQFGLISASTDEVVIGISGTAWGSDVTISKTYPFIPNV